ncbi:MAG: hypothetical protein JRC77_07880, partial [Deltaproteobacteria bacterium]|nr:hypothetical protein [Deltaproteobacteria bacterium]
PAHLDNWPCIGYAVEGQISPWTFQEDREVFEFTPEPVMCFDDLDLVRKAALEGLGAVHMGCQPAEQDVMEGRLVPLLTEWWPPTQESHLVYEEQEHMASRNRVFIEFVEHKVGTLAEYL